MKRALGGMLLLWVMALATPAWAGSTQVTFETRLYGLPIGRMVLANNSNGSSYAAKGHFQTTGLVGLLARVRFTMSARGVGDELERRSRSYSEDLDTGYRTAVASVEFGNGDRRIDPLTGLIAALLDRKADAGCAFDGETFDGARTMTMRIRPAQEGANGDLSCSGTLTRISGYSDEDMADWVSFPFSIKYERAGETLIVQRADIETIHGKVALIRR